MIFRSDLALEQTERLAGVPEGVFCETEEKERARITRLKIDGEEGRKALGKPDGWYITVELPAFSDYVDDENRYAPLIARELTRLLPKSGLVLIAGLGNAEITPDAIGPQTVRRILATRHLTGEMARVAGLEELRAVAAVTPNVLGKTGIEAAELLEALTDQLHPAAVIAVDALTARSVSRLGNTVQISDAGIAPGAGVGNFRPQIDRQRLGVPVIALGVPTVVDGKTLVRDLTGKEPEGEWLWRNGMMVTPREIDLLVQRAARMTALAINCALQPTLSTEEILMLQA